jgi:uncharacterized Zn finger protein
MASCSIWYALILALHRKNDQHGNTDGKAMRYWGFKPYVPVAERRGAAVKAAAKAKKSGATLAPIAPFRGTIARTFWGKAWCDNLERYSDYANRLPRGRTYARNGSVIDLAIDAGAVRAQVMGSSLYTVEVTVGAVPEKQWRAISAECAASIDSLVELLQGRLSQAVMQRICREGTGLFPAPRDIRFNCSCPDWASMCKHVAAVLYGVGARLDHQPELLFTLRQVDASQLVAQAGAGVPSPKKAPAAGKLLDDTALADVFGIEMAVVAAPARQVTAPKTGKPPTRKKTLKARRTPALREEKSKKTKRSVRPAPIVKAQAAKKGKRRGDAPAKGKAARTAATNASSRSARKPSSKSSSRKGE